MITPTKAYDLLDDEERRAADEYVRYAVEEQRRKREYIGRAMLLPIPSEFIRRSKSVLQRPIVRAAVAERIQEEALKQDVGPDRVMQELASIAFSKVSDFVETVGFGEVRLKNLEDIPAHLMGAVKSVEAIPTSWGTKSKIVFQDKNLALKMLAEILGIVAPDKPAPLKDYVAPAEQKKIATDQASKAYERMLEDMSKK